MMVIRNETAQAKFTVDADVFSTFKARCLREGVSMASVIGRWMKTGQPAKNTKSSFATRPLRKKAVLEIIGLLNDIMGMETDYRDNIPEQFENKREAADTACNQLAEAIACLEEAF